MRTTFFLLGITPRQFEMKKNVRRLLFALPVVSVLLSFGAVLVMFFGWGAARSELPDPNGYNDLRKAAQLVTGRAYEAPDLDRDKLQALITTNAEALRLVRVGLSHRCAIPADAQVTNFASASRDWIGLKSLAWVLSAEGRLAEMGNRPADAARSYVDAIRLGSKMSHGGLMMNRLVGIACEGVGSIPLVKLLPKLNCEQMGPLAADLQEIDDSTVPWGEVLQNENRFARAQMVRYPNPLRLASALWQARDSRRASQERHILASAHLRLLMVEFALRAYRCEQGSGPASLAQLVPKYLQHLPADPFSGKPLVYRSAGTSWIIYSLGPDRVDDGGKPVGKIALEDDLIGFGSSKSGKGKNQGDLFYDSPW